MIYGTAACSIFFKSIGNTWANQWHMFYSCTGHALNLMTHTIQNQSQLGYLHSQLSGVLWYHIVGKRPSLTTGNK